MERTLMIVKPDAVAQGHIGDILRIPEHHELRLIGMKTMRLTRAVAGEFYAIHKGKEFYDGLLDFMTSGKVLVCAVEGKDAVSHMRKIIGATDPRNADEGTIRKMFATDTRRNAVHGSDSVENGLKEVAFFFCEKELVELETDDPTSVR